MFFLVYHRYQLKFIQIPHEGACTRLLVKKDEKIAHARILPISLFMICQATTIFESKRFAESILGCGHQNNVLETEHGDMTIVFRCEIEKVGRIR